MENQWFHKSQEDTLKELESTKEGLTSEEAKKRIEKFGYNELKEAKTKGPFVVFLEQFKDLLVIILIIAALVSALTKNVESTVVIFVVIILNALLGTVQHFKAEQSLKSLKELSAPSTKVYRDGVKIELQSKEVVPGDIMMIEAGDLIVADARLLESFSLQVNESSLTGESESVDKIVDTIAGEDIALGDQKNMVFSGSLVTYGRGMAVVSETGMDTEIGEIAELLNQTKEHKTPLQVSLDDFSKKLSVIIIGICILVFALTLYRNMPTVDALMFAVALAVAAIPEALSSIVTIVLALGTQKMAKENAIIKKLRAVEGLGCVSVICSDKTGTLTQNKMTVTKIFADGKVLDVKEVDAKDPLQAMILESCVLCNDSSVVDGKEIGDPTETALVNLYTKLGCDAVKTRAEVPRLGEIPFDSDRKLMSTLHKIGNENTLITKGAVDVLLKRVKSIRMAQGVRDITAQDIKLIEDTNFEISSQGLRVLAYAYKVLPEVKELTFEDENDYIFVGLTAMIDPPREESAAAVAECRRGGIRPIMITGDHKITASSIAKQIGILEEDGLAVEGIELEKMSDEELDSRLESISVYARVSPAHKIRIVEAWQKKGHIVAMTGDGVNDAPALKKSDIGIAMGITGTEVSKDAASMILTDDNFATIVKAVTNGRNIYANIKNSIKFLLSGNMSGIVTVLYTSLLNLPIPFAAVQLLFINLVTDSLPAIAIGLEKSRGDLLDEKPRNSREGILTKEYLKDIASQGVLIGIFTIIAYHIGLNAGGQPVASTMAFATLCLARLFHGFNCRAKKSIFKLGFFTNPQTIYAFCIGFALLNLLLFFPPLMGMFEVAALSMSKVFTIYGLAFAPTLLIQLSRMIRKN